MCIIYAFKLLVNYKKLLSISMSIKAKRYIIVVVVK